MGRPPIGSTGVLVKFPPELLQRLDDWIAKHPHNISRPEAIRLMVEVQTGYRPSLPEQ